MKPVVKPTKKAPKSGKAPKQAPKVEAPKKVGKGVYTGKNKNDNSME